MQLREWTKIYLKQRDLIKREIQSLDETAEGLVKRKKDGSEEQIIIAERLDPGSLQKSPAAICCLNTKANVQTLETNWGTFSGKEGLLLIFANPKRNEQWLIKPHHHARIADPESLAQGLQAMHESVPAN